jgi:cytidyltransferase-like protein
MVPEAGIFQEKNGFIQHTAQNNGTMTSARGLLPGKFMVPHIGHLRLVEEAGRHTDTLTLLVCSSENDPVPGALRYAWMKSSFPGHRILHLVMDGRPPEFSALVAMLPQHPFVRQLIGDGYTRWLHGHSALPADLPLPEHVDLCTIPRTSTCGDIHSRAILSAPASHTDRILPAARGHFVRKVVLTGPESVGKTTLSRQLADHYQTNWVSEYGRTYTERFGQKLGPLDFAHIAGGQLLLEDQAALDSNRILFCDTDLIVTEVWGEIYLRQCPDWIIAANHIRRYDHFLLLSPDIHWVSDGIRIHGDVRAGHFQRIKDELDSRKLPYSVISGDFEARFRQATAVIDQLLDGPRP